PPHVERQRVSGVGARVLADGSLTALLTHPHRAVVVDPAPARGLGALRGGEGRRYGDGGRRGDGGGGRDGVRTWSGARGRPGQRGGRRHRTGRRLGVR